VIVKAWNNGEHKASGAGYGVKLSVEDRDSFFDQNWENVIVTLPNGVKLEANIKKASFWNNTCRELSNKKFGEWFIEKNVAPWDSGKPPSFKLTPQKNNAFVLSEI
jgi:hypothetical protein